MDLIKLKSTMIKASHAAGDLILKNINNRQIAVSSKSNLNDLVTEIDKACEQAVIKIIHDAFPDHQIVGEEYGTSSQLSHYQWIIDPIDGTVNFAHGIPLCCVSIGLAYRGEIIMGAVFNPMMNELFFAEKNQGSFLNNQKISVSAKTNFNSAVLVTGIVSYVGKGKKSTEVFDKLMTGSRPVRCIGSAALSLSWVACGRFDGYFEYGLNPWDVAAGKIILEEAGGRFSDFSDVVEAQLGAETLATNGKIHLDLLNLIKS